MRVLREEGVGAFYQSLPPRLMAVVPMIAIQVRDLGYMYVCIVWCMYMLLLVMCGV